MKLHSSVGKLYLLHNGVEFSAARLGIVVYGIWHGNPALYRENV